MDQDLCFRISTKMNANKAMHIFGATNSAKKQVARVIKGEKKQQHGLERITYLSPSLDMIEEVSEPRKNMRGIGRIRYIRTAQNVKGYLQCPTNNYQDISLVCQRYTKFSNLLALATSCYREHKPEGAKII